MCGQDIRDPRLPESRRRLRGGAASSYGEPFKQRVDHKSRVAVHAFVVQIALQQSCDGDLVVEQLLAGSDDHEIGQRRVDGSKSTGGDSVLNYVALSRGKRLDKGFLDLARAR